MLIKKNFSLIDIIKFSWFHIIWLTTWASVVIFCFKYFNLEWVVIPWLPLSLIGTAVAFYVGFKNNSAYDRLWEAREIWGGIVNSSRAWAATVKSFVDNPVNGHFFTQEEIVDKHRKLIHRHIAWVYTLRIQLMVQTDWEHTMSDKNIGGFVVTSKKAINTNLDDFTDTQTVLSGFLEEAEMQKLLTYRNTATHIIDNQTQALKKLKEEKLLDTFTHVQLQQILNDFYTLQGKCERIKRFPLPRQYASMSFVFISIFIFLLPFGMAPLFFSMGTVGVMLAIPFTVLIGWVYVCMELVGDYSENPFEVRSNLIPMLSICRSIEIDLREMLSEEEIPSSIKPVDNILI